MFEVFNMNVWWEDGGWVHKLLVKKNVSGSFILKYSFLIQMVSRTEGNIDDSLIGGNASAEGPEGEGTESTVITGVDIVMNHHLQETSFTKEAYKKYIKDYMKS